MRALFGALALLVVALTDAGPASAQNETYPSRTVRFLAGYAPGGGLDLNARLIAQHLSVLWNQQVIVDNRPGAAGMIATALAAQAAPDGYTLLFNANSHSVDPLLHRKLTYDPFKDFTPITEVSFTPNVVLVGSKTAWTTLSAFVAEARAKPGTYSYGVPGYGSASHLSALLFVKLAGLDLVPVQYRGGALSLQALMQGEIQVSVNNIAESLPQIPRRHGARARDRHAATLARAAGAADRGRGRGAGLRGVGLVHAARPGRPARADRPNRP
ncbi:MAG: tripartite tricarboxylate transporter substrate binding protein [Pseudomonadota bacterium]